MQLDLENCTFPSFDISLMSWMHNHYGSVENFCYFNSRTFLKCWVFLRFSIEMQIRDIETIATRPFSVKSYSNIK